MSAKSPMPTAAEIFGAQPSLTDDLPREFREVNGRYIFELRGLGIVFEVDRLRRERHSLVGEVSVRCAIAGARTYNGVLSTSSFNLSSSRARQELARHLAERAQAKDIDWMGLVEECCQRVLGDERKGQPAVLLRDIPKAERERELTVAGLPLLMRHPVILFGDGGSAKSYLALYFAGRLDLDHGVRVAMFDWELAAEDHRDRLDRLFGASLPGIFYARCERPLHYEVDRLRRIVQTEGIDYAVFDSIAPASDGPPEAAEVASRYFQSLRQLGIIGSLHVGHVSKADNADKRPFGSQFWHNLARGTWNVKLGETAPGGNQITVALHDRKENLSARQPSVGFELTFTSSTTSVRRIDVADVPELAVGLSLPQRIRSALKAGAQTRNQLADELDDVKSESLRRTVNRAIEKGQLVRFPGDGGVELIGLPARGDVS